MCSCTGSAAAYIDRLESLSQTIFHPKSFFLSSRTIIRQIQSNASSNQIPFYRNFRQHNFDRARRGSEKSKETPSQKQNGRRDEVGGRQRAAQVGVLWQRRVVEGSSSRFHRDNAVISCPGTGNWLHVRGGGTPVRFVQLPTILSGPISQSPS